MKKANCSLYETFNYGIQISLLLVIPQTTATTPNGCPKPLPTPTIRQLRTLDTGTQPFQCQGRKQTGRFVSQDVIGLVGGENFYQIFPNTQSWIDPLGLNAKLSEMAQSVHNLAEGLKTPDAGAIENQLSRFLKLN